MKGQLDPSQLEPGESKDIYLPIKPDISLVDGVMTFRVSATCFMENDIYEGKMFVKVSKGDEGWYPMEATMNWVFSRYKFSSALS